LGRVLDNLLFYWTVVRKGLLMETNVEPAIAWLRAETGEDAILMLKSRDAACALFDLYGDLRQEWKHGEDAAKAVEAERMWTRIREKFDEYDCLEFLV
jgi:hypothetical protein